MAALATQLEEAVVTALNAAVAADQVSQEFEASNQVRQEWTLEFIEQLRCVVLVTNQATEPLTRAMKQKVMTLEVGFIRRIGFDENGNLDQEKYEALRQLADEVELLLAGPIAGFTEAGPRVPQTVFDLDQEWVKKGVVVFSVIADFVKAIDRRA